MRKLKYSLNIRHLRRIKSDIVPALFTEHQFRLIEQKCKHKAMTASEQNEFSRTISRKMKAIYQLIGIETDSIFIYGKEKIRDDRVAPAVKYLKYFSRKFKNKHIFITGSFLYKEKYKDIDIFVMTKYDQEDYQEGRFHINYLTAEAYPSLFFRSATRLCLSNRKIDLWEIKEMVNIHTFIALYQELFNDFNRKFKGIKKTLREFLLQAAYLSHAPLPASDELQAQIEAIVETKEPANLIKKIFAQAIVLGLPAKKAGPEMREMIALYKETMREYPHHKEYYLDLIEGFQEVLALAGG